MRFLGVGCGNGGRCAGGGTAFRWGKMARARGRAAGRPGAAGARRLCLRRRRRRRRRACGPMPGLSAGFPRRERLPLPRPAFLPVCGLPPALQAGPLEGVQKGQRSGRSPRRRSRRCGRRPQKPPAGRFGLRPYPLPHPAIPLFAKSACEGGGYLL